MIVGFNEQQKMPSKFIMADPVIAPCDPPVCSGRLSVLLPARTAQARCFARSGPASNAGHRIMTQIVVVADILAAERDADDPLAIGPRGRQAMDNEIRRTVDRA
ncbi:MAG: hypothetical protein R3F54_02510 [Alphaproteobacteria bacterium]